MNRNELLNKCKELGIKNCSSKNKSQLIELLEKKGFKPLPFKGDPNESK